MVTGGEALVRALAGHGVDLVFGIPGTHNLEIYRHLPAYGIRHVGVRHEQGAGYAADGYARVTGRPGVCLVTSGPATLNAAAAIGQAYSDSVPVLLVSPGMPVRHPAGGTGELHETKDQHAALSAVAAHSFRVGGVGEVPAAVARAFAAMTAGRPRPVHFEVPYDVLAERAEAPAVAPLRCATRHPDPVALDAATQRLAAASRPVVLAGGGARGAHRELRTVAERLAAPVVTTANGKGTLPDDHPLAVGAGLHLPSVRALVEEADTVLVVGSELAPSDLWHGPLPLAGKLVRIDIDPMVADAGVVADAGHALRELFGRLPTSPDRGRAARWRARRIEEARAEGEQWLPLVGALGTALGRDGIVAGDSAMVCYYGALTNLPAYTPASFLYPTGYGTLGYGLPAAIGAKLARPDAPVVALLGDGGLMFTVAELATAAALRLPLPVVVADNGGYGEIRAEMAARGDPVHAVDLPAPDFAGLARALGCLGETDPPDLAGAVTRALAADRPTLIHVREIE